MKTILLLFFVFMANQGFSQLDTILCSDQFPAYINDAKYLALRDIFSKNDTYKDSVVIPYSHYIPILRDLYAIKHYHNYNLIDTIFNILNIHAETYPNTTDIAMEVYMTSWATNLYHDSIFSGNDTLDNLVSQNSLYYSNIYKFVGNQYIFDILSSYPVNMYPIENTISTMAYIINVSDGTLFFANASDITLVDSGYVRHYTFVYGWGDCPSGCTYNYTWKFSVYGDCVVGFDTSYGTESLYNDISMINISNTRIYPNPASNHVIVESEDNRSLPSVLKLYTIAGSLLREVVVNSNKVELDLSQISTGIYDIEIASCDIIEHKKLVITKER